MTDATPSRDNKRIGDDDSSESLPRSTSDEASVREGTRYPRNVNEQGRVSGLPLRYAEIHQILKELNDLLEHTIQRLNQLAGIPEPIAGNEKQTRRRPPPRKELEREGAFTAAVNLPTYISEDDLLRKTVFDKDLKRIGQAMDWTYNASGQSFLIVTGRTDEDRLGVGNAVLIPFDSIAKVGSIILLAESLDINALPKAQSIETGYSARLRLPRYVPKEQLIGKPVHDSLLTPIGEAVACTYTIEGFVGLVVVGKHRDDLLHQGEQVIIPFQFIDQAEDIILLSTSIDAVPLPLPTRSSHVPAQKPETTHFPMQATYLPEASKPPSSEVSDGASRVGANHARETESETTSFSIKAWVRSLHPRTWTSFNRIYVFSIALGMMLVSGGLFTIVFGTSFPSTTVGYDETLQSVAFIFDIAPGVPLSMDLLAGRGLTPIGICALIFGLNALLVGVGLWAKSKVAKWAGITIFVVATFFDLTMILQYGVAGLPWAVLGALVNGVPLHYLIKATS